MVNNSTPMANNSTAMVNNSTAMVNNSTNINKTSNNLSPQIIEQKKTWHDARNPGPSYNLSQHHINVR
jgi:hypothetical protein